MIIILIASLGILDFFIWIWSAVHLHASITHHVATFVIVTAITELRIIYADGTSTA